MLDDQDKQWITEHIGAHIGAVEARLTDRLERIETTLLRFVRANELRVRAGEATAISIQQRLDDLTDRVAKLETRP